VVSLGVATSHTGSVSAEKLELVRAAMFPEGVNLVELASTGRFEEAVDPAAFAPDVEVMFATPAGPPTEYTGMDGLLAGWQDWLVPWERYEVKVDELIDAGERVVALATLSGRTRHDGVEVHQPAAAVLSLSDGRITRVEFHLDQREALEAAGL
jgi:ketosteroid isomerase-like protein